MRCLCTKLFLDLNLAEGRYFQTVSKTEEAAFSSDKIQQDLLKEKDL
jgi:hypothetical protein